MMRSTSSPVPTGTVNLVTTTDAGVRLRDLTGDGVGIGQIGMAITAAGERANRDEHCIGRCDRLGQVKCEIQPLGFDIVRHQLVKLVDRDLAAISYSSLSTQITW